MTDDNKTSEDTTRKVEIDDNIINEVVERVVAKLRPSKTAGHVSSDSVTDLSEQVRKAVDEATASEKAKSADEKHRKALEDRLSALEARRESKPKEYRKLTRFMWGSDDNE